MSTILIKDEFFRQLAEELSTRAAVGGVFQEAIHDFLGTNISTDFDTIDARTMEAVNELIGLNAQEYQADTKRPANKQALNFKFIGTCEWTAVQFFKNLQFVSYNCADSFWGGKLRELVNRCAVALVMRTDEYDKADWGS